MNNEDLKEKLMPRFLKGKQTTTITASPEFRRVVRVAAALSGETMWEFMDRVLLPQLADSVRGSVARLQAAEGTMPALAARPPTTSK